MFQFNKAFSVLGIIVGLALIQACGRHLPEEESCNFVRNSQLQRISWAANTPVELFIDSSVPLDYYASIEAAAEAWNDSAGRELLRIRTGSNPGSSTPQRDGVTKIYLMDEWDEDRTTEQARTTVYWAGSTIYEADVRLNALNFSFFTSADSTDNSSVHLESLIIHELGHVLGLAHSEESRSVMRASLANGFVRDNISNDDLDSLKCEYK